MKLPLTDVQRLVGWKTAVVAIKAHPWRWAFGWGPETFPLAYRLHRSAATVQAIGPMRIADHVHNLPLELLMTLGVLGLAAAGWLFWALWEGSDEVGQAAMLGTFLMSLVEPVPFQAAALLLLIVGSRQRERVMLVRATPAVLVAALCSGVSLALWISDGCAHAAKAALLVRDEGARGWAEVALNLNPSSIKAMEPNAFMGVDVLPNVRLFHPHDADANQLAVVHFAQRGELDLAVIYARRAAAADPQNGSIVAQTHALEAVAK